MKWHLTRRYWSQWRWWKSLPIYFFFLPPFYLLWQSARPVLTKFYTSVCWERRSSPSEKKGLCWAKWQCREKGVARYWQTDKLLPAMHSGWVGQSTCCSLPVSFNCASLFSPSFPSLSLTSTALSFSIFTGASAGCGFEIWEPSRCRAFLTKKNKLVWLNLFNAELSPKRYWREMKSLVVSEVGDYT